METDKNEGMSRKSLHCKSLVLGYYPILPEMFWSSGFLIFRRKNRWKIIFDGSYGKLFSRSFSFYFSADFSIHSFLNNSWGNFVYKRNQGVECHGNHRTQLYQMLNMVTFLELLANGTFDEVVSGGYHGILLLDFFCKQSSPMSY